MKVLVVAANGRTGQKVVKAAVKKNHDVSVFVRPKEKLLGRFKSLKVFIGDATVLNDVLVALADQDVVISTIGHVKGSKSNVQTTAMKNLISAAQKTNKSIKIVSLTGTGVRQFNDKITIIDRALNLALALIDKPRLTDGQKHVDALKNGDINWSVVRVLKLTNSNNASRYKLTTHGPAKTYVSRSEAASALIEVAESTLWDKKLPIVSKNE